VCACKQLSFNGVDHTELCSRGCTPLGVCALLAHCSLCPCPQPLSSLVPCPFTDLVNQFRGVEGVITLHAGLPCPTSFPLTTISATTSSTSISQAHTPGAPACSGGSSPSQPPLYGLASQRPRPWWQFSLAPPSPHSCDTSNGRQAAPVPCHGDQQGSSGALCSGAHPASHSPCPSHPDHASTNGTHPVKNGAAHVNGLNGLAKGGEQALASSQHPHQQQQQQQQPSGQDGASSQGTGDLHISGQLVSFVLSCMQAIMHINVRMLLLQAQLKGTSAWPLDRLLSVSSANAESRGLHAQPAAAALAMQTQPRGGFIIIMACNFTRNC